jgi:hypothetical protein
MLAHRRRSWLRDGLRPDGRSVVGALGVCTDDRRRDEAYGAGHGEEKTNGRDHVAGPFGI